MYRDHLHVTDRRNWTRIEINGYSQPGTNWRWLKWLVKSRSLAADDAFTVVVRSRDIHVSATLSHSLNEPSCTIYDIPSIINETSFRVIDITELIFEAQKHHSFSLSRSFSIIKLLILSIVRNNIAGLTRFLDSKAWYSLDNEKKTSIWLVLGFYL